MEEFIRALLKRETSTCGHSMRTPETTSYFASEEPKAWEEAWDSVQLFVFAGRTGGCSPLFHFPHLWWLNPPSWRPLAVPIRPWWTLVEIISVALELIVFNSRGYPRSFLFPRETKAVP